jgi:hypothetical protein
MATEEHATPPRPRSEVVERSALSDLLRLIARQVLCRLKSSRQKRSDLDGKSERSGR